jgi:hypothetical protein
LDVCSLCQAEGSHGKVTKQEGRELITAGDTGRRPEQKHKADLTRSECLGRRAQTVTGPLVEQAGLDLGGTGAGEEKGIPGAVVP